MGRQGRLFAAGLAAVMVALAGGSPVHAAPPMNDAFASATTIPATPVFGTESADNSEATREPGEPLHAGDVGGKSIWYTWAPTPAPPGAPPIIASIDTKGTGFDTLLDVYTGSTLTGLTPVASNDDDDQDGSVSQVCFPVTGDTFEIAVDGYNGASGPITLNYAERQAGDSTPCPTLPPTISGPAQPKVGDTLSVIGGSFVDGSLTRSLQWARCIEQLCVTIHDATGPSYVVQARDVGTAICVDERVTTDAGTALNTSVPTATVATIATTHTNGRIFWRALTAQTPISVGIDSMLPDGSSLQHLTTAASGSTRDPAVSPDGRTVAFVNLNANGDIERMNADGSGVVDLGVAGGKPTWSPDGSRIAFRGSAGIETVDELGNVDLLVPLPANSIVAGIDWSPDGTKIAFSSRFPPQTDLDIAVVSADGRGPITQFTDPSVDDHDPSWSPTGDRIAFERGNLSSPPMDGDLYVMNADGTGQTLLYDGTPGGDIASGGTDWSPDGTTILFSISTGALAGQLATIPAGGGSPTLLPTDAKLNSLMSWAPAVSYTLTVTNGQPGAEPGGTVTSSPAGIACGGVIGCSSVFADGTAVTLTPNPHPGWVLSGWAGACSGTGPCTVSMLGDRSVTANFVFAPPGGGGGGGGGGSSSLTLSVTPASQTVASGGTASWTVSVTNAGGAYLYAVGVRDDAAPGCGIPSSFADTASLMAPGVTISYACSLAGVTSSLTNTVVATATTGPGDLLTQTATAAVTVQAPAAPTPAPKTPAPRTPAKATKSHRITGTSHADHLNGTAAADLINGLAGNDTINGGKGNDTILGGPGNDRLTGGPGKDSLYGGTGNDTILAADGTRDTLDCGPGRDVVTVDKTDTVARNCEVVHRR